MIVSALFAALSLALPTQAPAPGPDGPAPRAWIGVSLSTERAADSPGVLIDSVIDGSPAAVAGIHAGDRLMSIDEQPVSTYEELVGLLQGQQPGSEHSIWVRRELAVQLDPASQRDGRPLLGVGIGEGRYPGMVSITEIHPDTPAERAGLRAGDQLRSLDGRGTPGLQDLQRELADHDARDRVALGISRRFELVLGSMPRELMGAARSGQPGVELFGRGSDRPGFEARLREIEEARERARRGDGRQGRSGQQDEWRTERGQDRGADRREEWPSPQHGQRGGRRQEWREPTWEQPGQGARRMPSRAPQGQSLEAELRELSGDLRALREELSELRRELHELRRQR